MLIALFLELLRDLKSGFGTKPEMVKIYIRI